MSGHFLFALVSIVFFLSPVFSQSVPPSVIKATQSGVVEIVYKEPTDTLSYERPLPLDTLPYSYRTSPYRSIGSGFLIRDNVFVTAVHVLDLYKQTQLKPFYIRTPSKQVFEIDQILAFNYRKDFVIFTVKGGSFKCPFKPAKNIPLNEKIFAVGNALGEGIIIREGLLTSTTPEDINGDWKWLRFSAAASPGNSGGPLLNAKGQLVGLILRKSENENLNYALPIQDILHASYKEAIFDFKKIPFSIHNRLNKRNYNDSGYRLPLPMAIETFRGLSQEAFTRYYATSMALFLKSVTSTEFPNGPGSTVLLNRVSYEAYFPAMAIEKNDGEWTFQIPTDIQKTYLDNNGLILYGGLVNCLFTYLKAPETVSANTYITHSTVFIDALLKTGIFTRNMGSERIRISSLGNLKSEDWYTDKLGRQWLFRTWNIPYSDEILIGASLPTPEGVVSLFLKEEFSDSFLINDLKYLLNFVVLDYQGTLAQWVQFLNLKQGLPSVLKTMKLWVQPDRIDIYAPLAAFTLSNDLMALSPTQNRLYLEFKYSNAPTLQLENSCVMVQEGQLNPDSYAITRYQKPSPGVPEEFTLQWKRIEQGISPFDETIIASNGQSLINSRVPEGSDGKSFLVIQTLVNGHKEPDLLKQRLALFKKRLRI